MELITDLKAIRKGEQGQVLKEGMGTETRVVLGDDL
jgi:hypothetical protein